MHAPPAPGDPKTALSSIAPPRSAPPSPWMGRSGPIRHRFSFDEFEALLDPDGRIAGVPAELIDGEIYELPPMKNPRQIAITRSTRRLMEIFAEPYFVSPQCMHRFDERSAPLPDLVVLPREPPAEAYLKPDTPLLIVEVSDTTLRHDRRKVWLYASQGVPEYWLLDLNNRRLEVYREPIEDPDARLGWRYASRQILDAPSHVSPLAEDQTSLAVSDLLPS